MSDVESGRIAPGHAGAGRLVTQHGQIEPDVLADDDAAPERLAETLDQIREARSSNDV